MFSPKGEKISKTREIKKRLGLEGIPSIPSLCECEHCNTILWNGVIYVNGHHNKGDNNVMRNPEIAIKISGEKHYQSGKPLPEKTKEKMSKSKKGKRSNPDGEIKKGQHLSPSTEYKKGQVPSGKDSPYYGKAPSIKCNRSHGDWYKTPNQGIKFLRSQWEIKYAKYLDSQNIPWYYEFKGFSMNVGKESIYAPNGKDTTYHPDFWLPDQNKFVEVKGRNNYESWNNNDDPKLKSDKFRNDFKEYNYEVLFRDDLIKLGFNLKIKEPKFIFENKDEEQEWNK